MHSSHNGQLPVVYVDQQEVLEQSLGALAQSATLSFDLEFDNNRYSYGVTLCLIQVATPDHCFVIDGMVDLALDGLYALFENDQIQKLVHSPGEDLRLLHSLGCYPKNVFDTEVVARLLNYEQTSLATLLREKLGLELSKKHQKSNWLRRPLSDEQVRYAADDVLWLHPLKDMLVAEADTRGLLPFVHEEQDLLSQVIYGPAAKDSFLKAADLERLSPREQYILNELLRYRDELARQLDKPVYQVMSEEMVRALADGSKPPESIVDEPGVHPRFKNDRFAARLAGQLRSISAAAKNLSAERPARRRLTPAEQVALQRAAHDRDQVFAPIQQVIAERFGTNAAQLILSKRAVNEVLKGAMGFGDIRPAYRRALIREIAGELGIDLKNYVD